MSIKIYDEIQSDDFYHENLQLKAINYHHPIVQKKESNEMILYTVLGALPVSQVVFYEEPLRTDIVYQIHVYYPSLSRFGSNIVKLRPNGMADILNVDDSLGLIPSDIWSKNSKSFEQGLIRYALSTVSFALSCSKIDSTLYQKDEIQMWVRSRNRLIRMLNDDDDDLDDNELERVDASSLIKRIVSAVYYTFLGNFSVPGLGSCQQSSHTINNLLTKFDPDILQLKSICLSEKSSLMIYSSNQLISDAYGECLAQFSAETKEAIAELIPFVSSSPIGSNQIQQNEFGSQVYVLMIGPYDPKVFGSLTNYLKLIDLQFGQAGISISDRYKFWLKELMRTETNFSHPSPPTPPTIFGREFYATFRKQSFRQFSRNPLENEEQFAHRLYFYILSFIFEIFHCLSQNSPNNSISKLSPIQPKLDHMGSSVYSAAFPLSPIHSPRQSHKNEVNRTTFHLESQEMEPEDMALYFRFWNVGDPPPQGKFEMFIKLYLNPSDQFDSNSASWVLKQKEKHRTGEKKKGSFDPSRSSFNEYKEIALAFLEGLLQEQNKNILVCLLILYRTVLQNSIYHPESTEGETDATYLQILEKMFIEVLSCHSFEEMSNLYSVFSRNVVGMSHKALVRRNQKDHSSDLLSEMEYWEAARSIQMNSFLGECLDLEFKTVFYCSSVAELTQTLIWGHELYVIRDPLRQLIDGAMKKNEADFIPTNMYARNLFSLLSSIRSHPIGIFSLEGSSKSLLLIVIGIVSINDTMHTSMSVSSMGFHLWSKVLLFLLVVSGLLYEVGQLIQEYNKKKSILHIFSAYFQSIWNISDLLVYALLSTWFVLYWWDSSSLLCHFVLSSAAIPSSFGLIQYLSLSKSLGTLVLILFAMIKDVTQFAIIFFFCILGFGITFYGSFHFLAEFESPGFSFITMFSAALGNFDITIFRSDAIQSEYSIFGIIIYMIFICFVTLILCNLLLAQMACTYERLAQLSNIEWRYVKALTAQKYLLYYERSIFCMLPAPLNLITIIFGFFDWILSHYLAKKIGVAKSHSTDFRLVSVAGTVSNIILWELTSIPRLFCAFFVIHPFSKEYLYLIFLWPWYFLASIFAPLYQLEHFVTYVFKELTISGRSRVCPTDQHQEAVLTKRHSMSITVSNYERSTSKRSSHYLNRRILFTRQDIQRILAELEAKINQETDNQPSIDATKIDDLLQAKITELHGLLKEYRQHK